MSSLSPKNSGNRGIVWFRNDLRLQDNEALTEAMEACDEILPVYIFDHRTFGTKTAYGFEKTGANRADFILQSVSSLQEQLMDRFGARLHIGNGITEDILFDLAHRLKTRWVFCNRERTTEEVAIQDATERQLWSIGQEMRYSRGKMLLYTSDLPFPVTHTPDRFSVFRKEVTYLPIRDPLPIPEGIGFIDVDEMDQHVPTLESLGIVDRAQHTYKGGEMEGIKKLKEVIDSNLTASTEHESLALSPWISQGCLSPKMIYRQLTRSSNPGNQDGVDEVIRKLFRRDYHRLMGKKSGAKIFHRSGIKGIQVSSKRDVGAIQAWCSGETDEPLINAAMAALNSTGFLPYRLRVLVSSYFVHDLGLDWLVGAEYFESCLIDYDPCSNYGNWARIAGVGATPREPMGLNMEYQTKALDPEGTFIRQWT